MPLPRKGTPGDNLSLVSKRLDAVIDYLATAFRITASPELSVQQTTSGIRIGLNGTQQQASAANAASSSGVPVEIHEAWDSTAVYGIGDRVVHKSIGAVYPYVYEANEVPVSTDVPGSSGKWTKITNDAIPWNQSSSYSIGNTVMHGTPWQMYKFTANAATQPGEAPGSSSKWTIGEGVVFGSSTLPVYNPDNAQSVIPVPCKETYVYRETYDPVNHQLLHHIRAKTYDKSGLLLKVESYVRRITVQLVPHPNG